MIVCPLCFGSMLFGKRSRQNCAAIRSRAILKLLLICRVNPRGGVSQTRILFLTPTGNCATVIEKNGGQGRNRTADAGLFRAALYQLSYLAIAFEEFAV